LEELCGKEKIASDILQLINDDILEKTTREHTYYFKNLLFVDLIYKLIAPQEKVICHDKLALVLSQDSHQKSYLYHTGHGSNPEKALDALFHLADLCKEDVQYDQAINTYQLFIQKSQGPLEARLLTAHLKLCDIFVLTRNFGDAFQNLEALKNKIEASSDKINNDNLLTVLHKLTDVSIKRLDFDQAENYCLEAQPHIGDSPSAASFDLIFKNYLAYIAFKRGDIDAARKTYEKTHETWEKHLSPEEKLKVENNRLMEIYLLKQEYQNAIQFCSQNIETLKGTKNLYLLAFNYYALGETYFRIVTAEKRQDHAELVQKSIFNFQNCEKIARETQNHSFIFRSLNAIGNLYIRENNREQALESYKRAFAVASKTDEKTNVAVVGYNIGSNYNHLNQLEDAYSHLIFTINTLENIENLAPSNISVLYLAYNELCDIYIKKSEFSKAHGALEKSLRLFHQNPFLNSFEYWNHIWRAKVYFFENNKEEFEKHLKLAKELAKTDEEKIDLAQEMKIFDKVTSAQNEPKPEGIKVMNNNQTGTINANEDLKRIIEINKFINSEFDAEQLLKLVLNCAIQLSNAESGFVLLLAEDGSFEIKSSMNTKDDDAEKISMSIARLAIEKGEIISSSDALSDDRFDSSESIVLNELKSVICLPIRSKNKSIGVFYLDNRYRVHAFDNCNVALLNAFCDQVGIALENNHLINELMEARQKLEQKLKTTSDELAEVKNILKSESEIYKTRYAYKQIITQSQPMQEIFKLLDKVTETNLAICLHGASGTGKELVAKALHYNNPLRAQKRFVAINCGAIPANLMESELFGHKAGSFTGATKDKKGLFEEANGGTLFLDEIGELDPQLQVKLLRVLQEGEVQRIGDSNVIKVDVRIISATHKNLADMVKQAIFREDLFYRLCQMKIDLPSLRERKEDIPVLAKHFIEKFRLQNKLPETIDIPPLFMKCLIEYDWPGNVRELENLISVACALREGNRLSLENIPPNYGIKQKAAALATQIQIAENLADMGLAAKAINIDENNVFSSHKTWEQYESIIIAKCYELNGKKKMPTSDTLDLSHSTVYKKIAELGLDDTSNPLYAEDFTYQPQSTMKDYILKIFAAALKFHEGHPYAAIRQLGVSQGYFYKIMKEFKTLEEAAVTP
jgi:Nif-specific regulatory protein